MQLFKTASVFSPSSAKSREHFPSYSKNLCAVLWGQAWVRSVFRRKRNHLTPREQAFQGWRADALGSVWSLCSPEKILC